MLKRIYDTGCLSVETFVTYNECTCTVANHYVLFLKLSHNTGLYVDVKYSKLLFVAN